MRDQICQAFLFNLQFINLTRFNGSALKSLPQSLTQEQFVTFTKNELFMTVPSSHAVA